MPDGERKFQKFVALFQYLSVNFNDMKDLINENCFKITLKFIKKCEQNGLLIIHKDGFKLTKDGIFWGNSIAGKIEKLTTKEFDN